VAQHTARPHLLTNVGHCGQECATRLCRRRLRVSSHETADPDLRCPLPPNTASSSKRVLTVPTSPVWASAAVIGRGLAETKFQSAALETGETRTNRSRAADVVAGEAECQPLKSSLGDAVAQDHTQVEASVCHTFCLPAGVRWRSPSTVPTYSQLAGEKLFSSDSVLPLPASLLLTG
jgi:hypothetical protein